MKKVLLVSLLAIAGVSVSAQNLIKNEKFATEVTNKVTNPNKATAGEWFIMNNEADGVTTIAWEQTGDAKYPNAMKIDNSGAEKNTSWYKAFLGQRITDGLEKGVYVLTFYAKAKEAGTPVSVYIKQTNEEKNDNGKLNTTFLCAGITMLMPSRMLPVHSTTSKSRMPANGRRWLFTMTWDR